VVLATVLKALKLSVAVQRLERPFWQARYYDFNVFTERKRVEKLRYIHRNPVIRGLVDQPAAWKWASFRHYRTGERGVVEIASKWSASPTGLMDPHLKREMGGSRLFSHPITGDVKCSCGLRLLCCLRAVSYR
jgi:hypothetical protein